MKGSATPHPSLGLVGESTADVARAADRLRQGAYQGKPTTGFHALVTFGAMCERLSLYGFSGNGTLDNHPITGDHAIEAEHKLIARIAEERNDDTGFLYNLTSTTYPTNKTACPERPTCSKQRVQRPTHSKSKEST